MATTPQPPSALSPRRAADALGARQQPAFEVLADQPEKFSEGGVDFGNMRNGFTAADTEFMCQSVQSGPVGMDIFPFRVLICG